MKKQTRKKKTPSNRGKKPLRRSTEGVRIESGPVRLNKYIAASGLCSRRKADELIAQGVVKINGTTVTELGVRVIPGKDRVTVRGQEILLDAKLVYILLNKPKDYITTAHDEKNRKTVLDLVPATHRVFPVGRLDRNTTGALLLTNDGDLAYRLTHPSFEVEKAYRVKLDKPVSAAHLHEIIRGIHLSDGKTAPGKAWIIEGTKRFEVALVIHEGKNRQVRRMFESLGFSVKQLDRFSYAGLTTEGLKRGEWRFLTAREIKSLYHLVNQEKNTESVS